MANSTLASLTSSERQELLWLLEERDRRNRAAILEASLIDFVAEAWPQIDPSPFQPNWAIEAICAHLEAVTRGEIKRLLVNIPPRSGKTTIASICWPVWDWIQRERSYTSGPQVRFLCGSYNHELSLKNSNAMRRLINSPWFQEHWGSRFHLTEDQNTKAQYDTTDGGSRAAVSVGGTLIGVGGDIVIVDDPHNTEEVESEAERETTLTWWREISSTRLNNPRESAIVVIMQRLHEDDVSGHILAESADEWVHLMIPMRHDSVRHCATEIGWEDPRTEPGELMDPHRFGEDEVARLERSLGPYMAAGRLQQSPAPRGGGIIQSDWWRLWPAPGFEEYGERSHRGLPDWRPARFPDFEFLLTSVDTAYTEKEENDWSAATTWGIWRDRANLPRIMLVEAWKEHLELNALVRRIIDTAQRRKIDALLVEAKASGLSVIQEIKRLTRDGSFHVYPITPDGDKVARMHAVVPLFSGGLVFAPEKQWAQMVIDDVSAFPKGRSRDIPDTVSQALKWLRKVGLAQLNSEYQQADYESMVFRGSGDSAEAPYDV